MVEKIRLFMQSFAKMLLLFIELNILIIKNYENKCYLFFESHFGFSGIECMHYRKCTS